MRGLGALPVELLHMIAEQLCADAVEKAANGHRILPKIEDEADPNEMANEVAAEVEESDASSVEAADEMDVASDGHHGPYSARTSSTIMYHIHAMCGLGALSLTNRYLHRVFNPLLYRWSRETTARAVSWAIRRNSLATLDKAFSFGLDVNAKIYMSPLQDEWPRAGRAGPFCMVEQALRKGCEASLEWLLKHGATMDGPIVEGFPYHTTDDSSALSLAQVHYRNEDAALILLDHGANVFFAGEKYWDDEDDVEVSPIDSALHNAADRGHARVVKRLLLEHTIDVNMRNELGMTPLYLAARNSDDSTAIIELLFQHGASPPEQHMLPQMLPFCHPQNLALLLPAYTEYPRDFLRKCLVKLNSHIRSLCLYDRLPQRGQEIFALLSKLVEFGADFNYPPPCYERETEPLVSEVFRDFDSFLFRTLVELGANPLTKLRRRGSSLNIDLASGARMDVKDPATGQTIFETAVDLCSDQDEPGHECLQLALEHRNPENLASSHIYEVLESGLTKKKFDACIRIMRRGWISRTAQSFVFDWLISYATRTEVTDPGHPLDWEDPEECLAIRFFPWFLDREQLDELWKQALAFYHACASELLTVRWRQMPWWHINAERGDVEAIQMLCGVDIKPPSAWLDVTRRGIDRESGVPTPLTRAVSAGHRDVALLLLERELVSPEEVRSRCDHLFGEERFSACALCPDGLLSLFDMLLHRGEIEVLEAFLDCGQLPTRGYGYYEWEKDYVPRVLSWGHMAAEWLELKKSLSTNAEYSLRPEEEAVQSLYDDEHLDTIRAEMDWTKLKMSALRKEIVDARDAWLDRAEGMKRKEGRQEAELVPDGKDRVWRHCYS